MKTVKIHFDDEETGHAELLGGGKRARIANVPFGTQLNFDDVVEVKKKNGELWAGKVVQRRFAFKAVVEFWETDDLGLMRRAFESLGWALEGAINPGPTGKPGLAILAHLDDGKKPSDVAKAAGIVGKVRIKSYRLRPEVA